MINWKMELIKFLTTQGVLFNFVANFHKVRYSDSTEGTTTTKQVFGSIDRFIDITVNDKYEGPSSLLWLSFEWAASPEGHTFWENMNVRWNERCELIENYGCDKDV